MLEAYIAIFVCMATKAIPLENISDLSSKTFIAVFKRFISRCGIFSNIYSDNGIHFVAADIELQSQFDKQIQQITSVVAEDLAMHNIEWRIVGGRSEGYEIPFETNHWSVYVNL